MSILNPNEPLRAAYVSKIKAALGTIPVWAKKLPKDKPNADQYVLIMSQTKRRTEEYKSLGEEPLVANKFEWLCTINIDINNINQAGFAKPMNNDNVEETIINAIQSGITVPGFSVKSYDFIDSNDLDVETATQSIERRVITYQHWLCQE